MNIRRRHWPGSLLGVLAPLLGMAPARHILAAPRRDDTKDFSQALLRAVRGQRFEQTADRLRAGAPVGVHPSIDLAVVRFAPGRVPLAANVLFSREHPQGIAATIPVGFGGVAGIRFDRDLQDANGDSIAWLPGADWRQLPFQRLHGSGPCRFVAPYPASLLKLMIAVGVGLAVDAGLTNWADVEATLEPMIIVSSNEATDACVALLHRTGAMALLQTRLRLWGLHTLRVEDTTAAGGWRNADGAGVGHIHMTAWDTVRLLWLLDTEAPAPPWLTLQVSQVPQGPLLTRATCDHLRALLARQQLDEILSSGRLRDVPGWVPGLPDAPAFAHKTGTTDNYASDAGIVKSGSAHYIVAVLTNLGQRYAAPDPGRPEGESRCATTWKLPALGAALHAVVTART